MLANVFEILESDLRDKLNGVFLPTLGHQILRLNRSLCRDSGREIVDLESIDKLVVKLNKNLVSEIAEHRAKLQERLKVDQALPEVYRAANVADTTFVAVKSFADSPYSVDHVAAAAE